MSLYTTPGAILFRYIPGVGRVAVNACQSTPFSLGNVLVVDSVYGNDSTASVGGSPYKTVEAAVAAATSGKTIWVLPGTYTLASGITLPNGISLRGLSLQTTTLQMNVTSSTTMLTMGENCRVEDLTINLTCTGSTNSVVLKGIVFGGTSSQTSKLRTSVVTVRNSAMSKTLTSTVTGIEFSGTGALLPSTFSFNSVKGSTINVFSNGAGAKRGLLVSSSNQVSTRDTNVYVAQPPDTDSTGSYVGVETNDPANTGSIQLRSTTIGTVTPTIGQSYSASDILQTTPATISDPTYLASTGIQIGPGTDLITKTAGSKGFSTYVYPTTIYYGLKGNLSSGTSAGFLWPGTQAASAGVFPDPSGTLGRLLLTTTEVATNDQVTMSSTTGVAVNMPIVFDTTIANVIAGTTYYVYSVDTGTKLKLSTTPNGSIFDITSNVTATVATHAYTTVLVTATAVNSSNEITVSSTTNLAVGQPIVFTELLGNLVPGTPYYILTIGAGFITVTATAGGSTFTTGTASVSSPAMASTISSQVTGFATNGNVTLNSADGLAVAMPIVFAANVGTTLTQGTIYYIQAVQSTTVIRVSATPTGTAIVNNTNLTGLNIRANMFNITNAPAYYRVQQPAILSGISVALASPANTTGSAVSVQVALYRTPAGMNTQTSLTPIADYFVTFNDATTTARSYYTTSKAFGAGDKLHAYLTYFGGTPAAHDLTVQVDMF